MRYLLAALLGLLSGGAGGFLGSILNLQARGLRNGMLVRRGQPAVKDLILPPFHVPGALLGVIVAPLSLFWVGMTGACVVSAAVPFGLLLILAVGVVLSGRG